MWPATEYVNDLRPIVLTSLKRTIIVISLNFQHELFRQCFCLSIFCLLCCMDSSGLIRGSLRILAHSLRIRTVVKFYNHTLPLRYRCITMGVSSSTGAPLMKTILKVVRNKKWTNVLLPTMIELFETNRMSHFPPFYDDFFL